jgi:quercetin dioxygenase-like cupin family protein
VQANRHLELLKRILTLATAWCVIPFNPAREIKKYGKLDGAGPRERYVTEAEFAATYDEARPAVRAAMRLALLTELRRGDLVALTRSNMTDEGLTARTSKTGRPLVFAWTPELRAEIDAGLAMWPRKYPTPINQPVLLSRGRRAFTGDGLSQSFAEAAKARRSWAPRSTIYAPSRRATRLSWRPRRLGSGMRARSLLNGSTVGSLRRSSRCGDDRRPPPYYRSIVTTEHHRKGKAYMTLHRAVLLSLIAGGAIGAIGTKVFGQLQVPSTPGVKQVTLLNEPLSQYPGKRAFMFLAEFEPGAEIPFHRHPGTEFLYVMEGVGIMERPGQPPRRVQEGTLILSEPEAGADAFTHQVYNASDTTPLKTLVLVLHDEGMPPALVVEPQ